MPRRLFDATPALGVQRGTKARVYLEQDCSHLANITTVGDVAVVNAELTVGANHTIPAFKGPADGTEILFVQTQGRISDRVTVVTEAGQSDEPPPSSGGASTPVVSLVGPYTVRWDDEDLLTETGRVLFTPTVGTFCTARMLELTETFVGAEGEAPRLAMGTWGDAGENLLGPDSDMPVDGTEQFWAGTDLHAKLQGGTVAWLQLGRPVRFLTASPDLRQLHRRDAGSRRSGQALPAVRVAVGGRGEALVPDHDARRAVLATGR